MMFASSRDIRRVLAAETVSNFGSMLSRLAIPWLATLVLDASPLAMAFLVMADVVAGALSALVLGVLVDRRDKRRAMLTADFARAAVLGVLAALAYTQMLAFWMLVAAAVATGLLTEWFEMARSAWMADRIAENDLSARNAQVSVATSLSETVAFALGGWLYQGLGAVLALTIDALSYLASALCLTGVARTPAPAPVAKTAGARELLVDMRAGIAAVRAAPALRALACVELMVALAMSITGTCYMIFVTRDLAFDPGTLGMIFATGGLGALAGAVLAPRLGRYCGSGTALAAGLAVFAVGMLCLPLAPAASAFGIALLIAQQVVGDSGHTLYAVHDRTLRQVSAPSDLLARVDAVIRTLGHAAKLAGALAGGLLATWFGTRMALGLATGVLAIAAVYAYAVLGNRKAVVAPAS